MTPLTLLLDTESSGLIRKGLPLDHESQPHLLEVAAKLVNGQDETLAVFNALIKPDNWSIEAGATSVHGITETRAHREGIPVLAALIVIQSFAAKAANIAAHNAEFDHSLVMAEVARAKGEGTWWRSRRNDLVCTMLGSKDILKIPGRFDDYKYPSLEEAHTYLCPDHPWTSTHRAMDDLEAMRRVWLQLQKPSPDPPIDG